MDQHINTLPPGKTRLQYQDDDGMLPTVYSLHAGALPPKEPPDAPPSQLDDVTSPSFVDDSVNSNKSYVELRLYIDSNGDSSSSSSSCGCGNCERCDDC